MIRRIRAVVKSGVVKSYRKLRSFRLSDYRLTTAFFKPRPPGWSRSWGAAMAQVWLAYVLIALTLLWKLWQDSRAPPHAR